MKFCELNGKTIKQATRWKYDSWDDEPFLKLEFTDGSHCWIVATYGCYTGESSDEYPSFIGITEEVDADLEDIPHLQLVEEMEDDE